MGEKCLLFYIEPAPYILALCRALKTGNNSDIRVYFIEAAATQPWEIDPQQKSSIEFLPENAAESYRYVRSLLQRGEVDVVHLAGWGHPLLLRIMLLAWWRRIPIFIESDTQFTYLTSRWKRLIKRLVYPFLFRLPFRFLPGGSRQAKFLLYYGVAPEKIRIAQMTVDVRDISRRIDLLRQSEAQVFGDQRVRFLFVGRLEFYKGLSCLLEAFRLCFEVRQDVELVIVGDGAMRPEVEYAVSMQPRIRYLGRLAGEDMIRAYGMADVFVLPSHFEPWGLVVNEAMAAGLPVILSNEVGCADDLVQDGRNGLVVPSGDPVSLAQAMLRLASDTEARREMGRTSRNIISQWTIEDEARIVSAAWAEIE